MRLVVLGSAAFCLATLGKIQPAHADIALGAPKAPPSRAAPPARVPDHSDDSSSLRQGLVTSIGERGDRVEIQGRWHVIDSTRTRFIRSGQVVHAEVLKKGQTLKFTLLSGTGKVATLGVVYVP